MNKLFLIIVFIAFVFSACQEGKQSKINDLSHKITRLENRIDSLVAVIWDIQTLKEANSATNLKSKTFKKVRNSSNSIARSPQSLPEKRAGIKNYSSSSSSYSSSNQCQGITKKGSRCKRMVRSGSYCWQHGS